VGKQQRFCGAAGNAGEEFQSTALLRVDALSAGPAGGQLGHRKPTPAAAAWFPQHL
jgi:hypothetical protein